MHSTESSFMTLEESNLYYVKWHVLIKSAIMLELNKAKRTEATGPYEIVIKMLTVSDVISVDKFIFIAFFFIFTMMYDSLNLLDVERYWMRGTVSGDMWRR